MEDIIETTGYVVEQESQYLLRANQLVQVMCSIVFAGGSSPNTM